MASVNSKRQRPAAKLPKPEPARESSPTTGSLIERWRIRIRHSTFWPALAGAVLLFAALPPLDLWPLAWLAPVPWVALANRGRLPGKRPYTSLWLAGFVLWLGAVHWLRLPHPAVHLGWLALSFYLALYLPAFVGLTRVAKGLGVSTVIAAPVVWTGLELFKGHLLSGFSMGLLGHTQFRWLPLIQMADLGGAYAVSFLVMLVAACLARMWPTDGQPLARWPAGVIVGSLAMSLAYGYEALSHDATPASLKIALIQGNIDTQLKADPGANDRIHREYFDLTRHASRQEPNLDLIVWPETMYRLPLVTFSDDAKAQDGENWRKQDLEFYAARSRDQLKQLAENLGTNLLFGMDTVHYANGPTSHYNSAVFVNRAGEVVGRYDKMHPVAFGEYMPLAEHFPWLYRVTPLAGGIQSGKEAPAFPLKDAKLVASICFESAVPHLIRRQVVELRAKGQEPDVLMNVTNDGWFRGSSELDMHLTCGLFRAVELRKPFLVAANTGFSAWIDANGRIVRQGRRRETDVIVANVSLDRRRSLYSVWGDVPAGACLACCAGLTVVGLVKRRREKNVTCLARTGTT